MQPLTRRLRCQAQTDSFTSGYSLEFWRGSALVVQLGIFDGNNVADLSDVASVTLRVKDSRTDTSGVSLMSQTIENGDFEAATSAQWTAGTHQHVVMEFSNAECNLDPGSEKKELWYVVTALLGSGDIVTIATGKAIVYEDNSENTGTPPENPDNYFNAEEALGMIAANAVRFSAAQTLTTAQKLQAAANLGQPYVQAGTDTEGLSTVDFYHNSTGAYLGSVILSNLGKANLTL